MLTCSHDLAKSADGCIFSTSDFYYIHMFSFFSNNSTDKLLIESALDNTEKIVANILANANQGKRQVVLKERWVVPS